MRRLQAAPLWHCTRAGFKIAPSKFRQTPYELQGVHSRLQLGIIHVDAVNPCFYRGVATDKQ